MAWSVSKKKKNKAAISYQWLFTISDGLQQVRHAIQNILSQVPPDIYNKYIDSRGTVKNKSTSVSISASRESLASWL